MTTSELNDVRLPAGGIPTTAFEAHMLADDRPSHPMVIVSRFLFSGPAPREALSKAFDAVIQDEPLLTAKIDASGFGLPRWVPGPTPTLHYSSSTELRDIASLSLPHLDPHAGPMFHAEVGEHPAGWTIDLAVHHAACDGLGLVAFMERWLLAAAGLEGRRPRPPRDVLACLRTRGRVAASWKDFMNLLPDLGVGLAGVRQFLARRVAELGQRSGARDEAPPGPWRPAIIVKEIDPPTIARFEAVARDRGVTVNDVFLAALLAAITEAVEESDGWVRLGVPVSLRTKSDHLLPAANRVSMVFLDRQRKDGLDHASLVTGIHDEMEIIRTHSLGHIMPMSLEVTRLLPGGLRRAARRPAPQATAVLSNLGRCFHRSPLIGKSGALTIGASVLDSWWVVPPVRPGTTMAIATHETAGRRTVAAHLDPTALTPHAATMILERFAAWARDSWPLPSEPAGRTSEANA